MRYIPIIVMGLSSILLQIIIIRQLLSTFSGNELDIGITLSIWLIAVGIGSYIGYRIRFKNALAIAFLALALLSQPTILITNLIRPIFSAEPGEVIPLTTTITSTIITLLPLCLIVGLQFPLSISYFGGDTAKVYRLEALGAFMGGIIFTLMLSGKIDVSIIAMSLSIINFIIALLLLRKKSLITLLLIPLAFYLGINKVNKILQWDGMELIKRVESRYGAIKVFKIKDQLNLYASGKFQFSYPDVQTEELRAHIPLLVHPSPSYILSIGGPPAVLREFLKYPLSIDFVEIDPEIVRASFDILSKEDKDRLNDRRLRIITMDGRRFVKTLNKPRYDLVIFNLPEPSTANINRFYTVEFFREIKGVLNRNGILSVIVPTSSGYIGRRMQTANGSIYNSLKKVFKDVEVSSEEYGYILASDSPIEINPDSLKKRFSDRSISTSHFRPYIIDDAFSPLKVRMVKERFGRIDTINQDIRPVAYIYNLMLWAETHGGRMLNYLLDLKVWQIVLMFLIVSTGISAFLWRKRGSVYFSIFTMGYSTMAFSVIIILAYQARFGYVYERIGLLTASFMVGMAMGAYIIKEKVRPLRWLQFFEVITIMLFISSPLFFKQEAFFYLLSLLCGMIGGIQFVTANQCMKGEEASRTGGRFYTIDLAGSFLGALLTSIFIVPLLGILNSLFSLVLIKGVSLLLLLSIKE